MKKQKKRTKKDILIDVILIIIIVALLAAAGVLLYRTLYPNNTPMIKKEVVQKDQSINWNALKAKNPDTVGWLTIEGTNIDTPIVQTTDNDYYLNIGFDGEYDECGVPFLDCDYQWDQQCRNSVIYGHSTQSTYIDYMFDALLNYHDDPEFLYKNTKIEYKRPEEQGGDGVFEIFAVLTVEADYDYRKMSFADDDEFVEYYRRIKEDSWVCRDDIAVSPGDEILTLSTCNRHAGLEDGRTAVIAKRVK